MKIQELFETEKKTKCYFYFDIRTTRKNITHEFHKNIYNVYPEFKLEYVGFYEDDNIRFKIFLPESIYSDLSKLEELRNRVTSKMSFINKSVSSYVLYFDSVPTIPVFWYSIAITSASGISLKNIHKFISCDILSIFEISNITDSVLGLLKVKTRNIRFGFDKIGWTKIIQRHFNSDKDIVACSEELIEKGLKEYAKF